MARSRSRSTTPPPPTLAARQQRDQQQRTLVRLAALLLALGVLGGPSLPSAWRARLLQPLQPLLDRPFPAAGLPIAPRPLAVWLSWLAAALGLWLVAGLMQHWAALQTQRRRPLGQPRTYLRLRIPPSAAMRGQADGVALLRQLISLLPNSDPRRGTPAPLVLRWTGKREKPVQQGVSLWGERSAFITPMQKTLLGLAPGTEAEVLADPVADACTDGTVLCWCDVTLAGPDDLPLHIPRDRESPLIEALIPALSPQADVIVSEVQVLVQPVRSLTWRGRVLARLEGSGRDLGAEEQRMLKAKADGPAVAVAIRLLAVATTPAAGQAMLQTLAGTLAASAQRSGLSEQRLVAGPLHCLPAVLPAPPSLRRWVIGLWSLSILGALALGGLLLQQAVPLGPWWALPLAALGLPPVVLAQLARRRGHAIHTQLGQITASVPPPRNPQTIPLWHPWFGHQPLVLSAAEVATLWQPPAASLGERVERVPSRWIDAPARVFLDPSDPQAIALGQGRKSDGSWAPIGLPYPDFRYIAHITAPMGRGKSEYLRWIFQQLMHAQSGAMLVDCKGTDLVVNSIPLIPLSREGDVTILELGGSTITGEDLRASMNLLSPALGRSLNLTFSAQASTVIKLFAMLEPRFATMPGVQQFANMGVLALLEGEPQATLMHLIRFYGDEDYRAEVCGRVRTAQVADFWLRRFPAMDTSSTSSLQAFERRLDRMLAYPELSALLIAPGCSIDLRQVMDTAGILLFGVKATEGEIAALGANLLLMQVLLAAMSRSNVPEDARPDIPLFIDEAQIVFKDNIDLAQIMFSQFRAFRIGTIIVHQNLDQLPPEVMTPLAGNAQTRVILGAKEDDAQQYARNYGALGLTAPDFTRMERFFHQYVEVVNSGLFTCRMPPLATPLAEDAPPPVYDPWQHATAAVRSEEDRRIDDLIRRFAELARFDRDVAVQRLAALPLAVFDAYCARTKAHRAAQRQRILDHPGSIPCDPTLTGEAARLDQKNRRIRTLSALRSGTPKLETEALAYRLLYETAQAEERRAMAEAAAAPKKGSKGGAKATAAHDAAGPTPDPLLVTPEPAEPPAPGASAVPVRAGLPTYAELLAARGTRRDTSETDPLFDALGGLHDDAD